MFKFLVYRDGDARLRLRKVVIELYHDGRLVDRRRMFAAFKFAVRLKKKQDRMLKLGLAMVARSWEAPKKEV